MKQEGSKPPNYLGLEDRFQMQSNLAHKARKTAVEEGKSQSKKEKGVLKKFYLDVYHSASLWSRYDELIQRLRENDGEVEPLSKSELLFATGFVIMLLTAQNFKRAGNAALIEADDMFNAVNQAFGDYLFRFSDESVKDAPRRLDRSRCVGAVVEIKNSTKLGTKDSMAILRPRDQRAIIHYHRYVRPNGPKKPETTKFFINGKGGPLGKDVWLYLRRIAEDGGIKDLTFNTLRKAIETENGLDRLFIPGKKAVSDHLGHSEDTAEHHYRIQDARYPVQAASRILFLLEDVGEAATELVSPVKVLTEEVSFYFEFFSVQISQ